MSRKKYRLAPEGAMKTRYETTEFIVLPRVSDGVRTANRGLILQKGTNILIIDDNVKISDEELSIFVENNFHDKENTLQRLKAIINPSSYTTIM